MSKVKKITQEPLDDSVGFQHSEDVDAYIAKLKCYEFVSYSQPHHNEIFDEEEFIGHSQRLNREEPEVICVDEDATPPKDVKDGSTQTEDDLGCRKLEDTDGSDADGSDTEPSDTDSSNESGVEFCLKIELGKRRENVARKPSSKKPRMTKPRIRIIYMDESPEKGDCAAPSPTPQASQGPLDLSTTGRDAVCETPKRPVARNIFEGITLSRRLIKKQGDKV
jgi:hypothetical protein